MPSRRRHHLARAAALLCVAASLASPAVAGAWGPQRSGGLGHQALRGGPGADYLRGNEGPDTVRGFGGGDLLTGDTGPDGVSVSPRAGDVAIAGLQLQLVIERSARLLRRAPRLRLALSHPAALAVEVTRGRGGRALIRVDVAGYTGANIVKIPARRLHALRQGRYTVRATAKGATGATAIQTLALAIVPPLR